MFWFARTGSFHVPLMDRGQLVEYASTEGFGTQRTERAGLVALSKTFHTNKKRPGKTRPF